MRLALILVTLATLALALFSAAPTHADGDLCYQTAGRFGCTTPTATAQARPTQTPTATRNLASCEVAPPSEGNWQCIGGKWVLIPLETARQTATPTATRSKWICEVAPPNEPGWQCLGGRWVFVPSPTPSPTATSGVDWAPCYQTAGRLGCGAPTVQVQARPTQTPTPTRNPFICEVNPPNEGDWRCVDGRWVLIVSPTPTATTGPDWALCYRTGNRAYGCPR